MIGIFPAKKKRKKKKEILTNSGSQPQTIVLEGAMWRARCHRQALGKLSYAQWKPPKRGRDSTRGACREEIKTKA
jgi:hypothetical protein